MCRITVNLLNKNICEVLKSEAKVVALPKGFRIEYRDCESSVYPKLSDYDLQGWMGEVAKFVTEIDSESRRLENEAMANEVKVSDFEYLCRRLDEAGRGTQEFPEHSLGIVLSMIDRATDGYLLLETGNVFCSQPNKDYFAKSARHWQSYFSSMDGIFDDPIVGGPLAYNGRFSRFSQYFGFVPNGHRLQEYSWRFDRHGLWRQRVRKGKLVGHRVLVLRHVEKPSHSYFLDKYI